MNNISPLNLTPAGLFPNDAIDTLDEKHLVIAKVYQEMSQALDMSNATQQELNEDATRRYQFLSQEQKLSLIQVDHAAFSLFQQGVQASTVKAYFSFRLSENDAKRWQIFTS